MFMTDIVAELDLHAIDNRGRTSGAYDPEAIFQIEGNEMDGFVCWLDSWLEPRLFRNLPRRRPDAVAWVGEAEVLRAEERALEQWMDANGVTLVSDQEAMG